MRQQLTALHIKTSLLKQLDHQVAILALKVIASVDTLGYMNRENETGVKTGKITPYRIFGWVPLGLFFAAAGTMAFFGFLKGL